MEKNFKGVAIVVVIVILLVIVYFFRNLKGFQEMSDETYYNEAIMELSKINGKVEEIMRLYEFRGLNDEKSNKYYLKELDTIASTSFDKEKNPYLSDVKIKITSNDISEICEEITLQIEQKIKTLIGEKGDT